MGPDTVFPPGRWGWKTRRIQFGRANKGRCDFHQKRWPAPSLFLRCMILIVAILIGRRGNVNFRLDPCCIVAAVLFLSLPVVIAETLEGDRLQPKPRRVHNGSQHGNRPGHVLWRRRGNRLRKRPRPRFVEFGAVLRLRGDAGG